MRLKCELTDQIESFLNRNNSESLVRLRVADVNIIFKEDANITSTLMQRGTAMKERNWD
jgi:hypothetical protein